MKTVKINRSSWHYQLARTYGDFRQGDDFCTYFWQMIKGLLFCLVIVGGCLLVLVPIADAISWAMAAIACHCQLEPDIFAKVFLIVVGVVLIGGLITLFVVGVALAIKQVSATTLVSGVGDAYRSWHDKYCSQVEIE